MSRLKKYFVRGLAVVGGLVIGGVIVAGIVCWAAAGRVPGQTILEVDFEKTLIEYVPDEPVAKIMVGKAPTVRKVVEALERASTDKRVTGLVARIGQTEMQLGMIQELRDAVLSFRKHGKPAVAYAETFGEGGVGTSSYYLATAFDEIYLQPSGDVGLTGILYERSFIRGTLEKLGFSPRMDHRKEYKSAMNVLTERKFTEPHREVSQRILDSQFGQIVKGIAQARKFTEDEVRALVDRGPFLGHEALDAKLVDGLAYRDELYGRLKDRAGKGAKFLYLSKYLERAGSPYDKGQTIALIYGVGGVQRGKSRYDPIFQEVTMGSDTIAAAFRAAVDDKDVRAILFRVDSPGGSYVASDTIWRETVRARKAGKPVIVTMGSVAGSGGYFVSMSADKIVAQPATITASIGVVSGKFITTNFWDKLGISWDEVHTGTNATLWTGLQDYTPEQWARFGTWLDRIYEDFTSKVAAGRNMPLEKVLEIAKGRVWTGEDAKALGLVDELGGFPVALRLAREAAHIPADAKIRLKIFPEKKSLLAMFLEEGPDSSEKAQAAMMTRVMETIRPVARIAKEIGLTADPGVLIVTE